MKSIPFGLNPAGGRLGFRREFGEIGVPDIVAGPGMMVKNLGGGKVALEARRTRRGSGGVAAQPFDVTVSGTADPRDVTVRPGTVNSLLPNNMFTVGATPVSGTRYVTLAVTTSGGMVTLAQISMDLTAPDALPVEEGTVPTSFKVLLAIIVDATLFQVHRGNIIAMPKEAFRVDLLAPAAAGAMPYVSFWSWALGTVT